MANKFGIYESDQAALEIHSDCGIVYYPKRPYSLCVMVRSDDKTKSIAHVSAISKVVYDYVASRP